MFLYGRTWLGDGVVWLSWESPLRGMQQTNPQPLGNQNQTGMQGVRKVHSSYHFVVFFFVLAALTWPHRWGIWVSCNQKCLRPRKLLKNYLNKGCAWLPEVIDDTTSLYNAQSRGTAQSDDVSTWLPPSLHTPWQNVFFEYIKNKTSLFCSKHNGFIMEFSFVF